jgi:hypothetical protein
MSTEPRSYEAPALVTHVARYMPAERTGLVKGDLILAFGTHSAAEVIADREIMAGLKRNDWLLILRDKVVFRLAYGEGVEGCVFESANAVEVNMPLGINWPTWWGGVQRGGAMVLVPDRLTRLWSICPPLLFVRYRNWLMFTANMLVYLTAFVVEGPITCALAYLITVAVTYAGGPALLRDTSEKEGFVPRGHYAIASWKDAAALELTTKQVLNPANAAKKAAPPQDAAISAA